MMKNLSKNQSPDIRQQITVLIKELYDPFFYGDCKMVFHHEDGGCAAIVQSGFYPRTLIGGFFESSEEKAMQSILECLNDQLTLRNARHNKT